MQRGFGRKLPRQDVHLLTLSPPRRKVSRDPSAKRTPRYERPSSSTVRMELYGENVREVPISERQIGPMSLLELPEHTLRLGVLKEWTRMIL